MKTPGLDASGHAWSFHEKPWRHYQCDGKRETPNGLKIASVTQILGTLDKPALVGWAANKSIEGCWHVMGEKGFRRSPDLQKEKKDGTPYTVPGWRILQGQLKTAGLDHNAVRDEAALRGTTVHTIFEDWVNERKVPSVKDYPEAWQGYIRALAGWLTVSSTKHVDFEVAEVIVGSATHGFAGTCDAVAVTVGKDGQRTRWDLKTTKQIYARTHYRQLAAYELASVEMGNEPTDRQAIVALHENGNFDVAYSTASASDFLNVLAVWRDDQPLIKLDDAAYKVRIKGASGVR